ncbi:MAG: hypothetical protein IMW89_17525, partial [Ktedonobacteraceae bacterium]|nr:hypothetical protein [Ktedonobacteraceae bacterium]
MGFDFFSLNRKRLLNIAITTLLIVLAVAYFVWFSRTSNDPTPDSFAGYLFAISGTVVLLLAAVRYSMHRRSRKRTVGLLSRSLNWHISLGILALVLIILHSFGNFNPRSGTYALFALVALVISGAIGRLIDRIAPGKIAQTASQALTEQGEDRIESITRGLQALVTHNRQQVQGVKLAHDAHDNATDRSLTSSTSTTRAPATSSTARLNEQSLPAGWPAPRQKPEEAQILRSSWD